ncbi:hypothetical protein HPB48_021678 [Haemaphysalis longicornis]|uniref:Carboxylesterase type B domain-containing protein n=1 Tax=Haemaphysalis longicornis TaxID=44386 RepID=A0A9J6FYT0_HAELO|nr:hypothetical protein HPB48_021678 [Haemaphysalis longicornis]
MIALNEVIVVSANFRSAIFGVLEGDFEGAQRNVALWDQLLVMRWVRANIAGFGGDPELVTVIGNKVAWELGCGDTIEDLTTHPVQVLRWLRDNSAEDITSATENATMPRVFAFLPTFNTEYVPYLPAISTRKG